MAITITESGSYRQAKLPQVTEAAPDLNAETAATNSAASNGLGAKTERRREKSQFTLDPVPPRTPALFYETAVEAPELPALEVAVSSMPDVIQMKFLMDQFSHLMIEIADRNVDAIVDVKDHAANEFAKKMEDLQKKLEAAKDAAASLLNKLPGWVMGIASAFATCLVAFLAVTALIASGGIAAAPLMAAGAAALSIGGMSNLILALGTIGWNVEGHEGSFGFVALEQSGALKPGVGSFFDAICTVNLPALANSIGLMAKADPEQLMIISAVFTAVTLIVMIGAFLRRAPALAAKEGALEESVAAFVKNARAAGGVVQTAGGGAAGADAAVTANTSDLKADATKAQAEQDRAQILLDAVSDLLLQLIKFSADLIKADASSTDSVLAAMASERHTASQMVGQNA